MFQTVDIIKLKEKTNCTSKPVASSKSSGPSDAVLVLKNLKKNIVNQFHDIPSRLQLSKIPACLLNLRKCSETHSRKSKPFTIADSSSQYLPQQMILESRYRSFCKLTNDMLGRDVFPNRLILTTLELILTLNPATFDSNSKESLTETLDNIYSVFTNITLRFPPCYFEIRQKYLLELLKTPENEDLCHLEGGILCVILELMRDAMNYDQKSSVALDDESRMFNYFYWEKSQMNQKSTFKQFDRSVRFDRLFKVLDLLLTRVLEYDMALWLVKYAAKVQTYIYKRGPLITALLWQNNDNVMIVNATIKNILSIFVDLVALEYPKHLIKIFSRLINLVANACNLYEYPDDTIQFPIYKNITSNFVSEIVKVLENSPYYCLQLFLKVIENVEHPLIKMLLCDKLFLNLDSICHYRPSLETVYERLTSKKFLEYSDQTEALKVPGERFPLYNKNHRLPPKIKLSKSQYIRLLQIQAQAIILHYKIDKKMIDCISAKNLSLSDPCIYAPFLPASFDMVKYKNSDEEEPQINLNEAVELRVVDKAFKKLVHIRIDRDDFLFYRTQVKYFLLLDAALKACLIKYGNDFKDFVSVIKHYHDKN